MVPNWCENELRVKGNRETLRSFRLFAEGDFGSRCLLDFNQFVPYPEKFLKLDRIARDLEENGHALKQLPMVENRDNLPIRVKDGYNQGGFEWCAANWGTARNAWLTRLDESDNQLLYHFITAWSPPEPVVLAMSQRYPTLTLDLRYQERGNCFQGIFRARNGQILRDEYWEIWDFDRTIKWFREEDDVVAGEDCTVQCALERDRRT